MNIDVSKLAAGKVLATLNTGAWRPTRLHKPETRAENQRHGTGDKAKVLLRLTDHSLWADIAAVHAAAYADHRLLTFPAAQDGFRLLAAGKQLDHADRMRQHADRHNQLVAQVAAVYASEKASAPARHNGLYDASLWPAVDAVVNRFSFNTRYLPCPTDGAWGEWLAESAATAVADMRERLHAALERVASRCSADGRLHETVFTGLAELLELVPDFDVDGRFASTVAAAESLLEFPVDAVRDSDKLKAKLAARAQDILASLPNVE